MKKYYVEAIEGVESWYRDPNFAILHREDGPAFIGPGFRQWYLDGKLHREDGPAVVRDEGTKMWYYNGDLHRDGGPAIEWASGTKVWMRYGRKHRIDGPAVEVSDGTKEWWIDGKFLTEKEFLTRTQPNEELTIAQIEQLLNKRIKVVK